MKPTSKLRLLLASISLALSATSAYSATDTYNTAGTFNWLCPAGVTSIQVECWGGGGAGGGASREREPQTRAVAVVVAEPMRKKTAVPVTPGITYVVTIPAAATCPASFTNDARFNGSSVTFTGDGGTAVTAAGGAGGQSKVATTAVLTGLLGTGGTTGTSVGDIVFAGGSGSTNTSSNGGAGGAGASDLATGNNATAGTATNGATTTGSDAAHNGGAGGVGKTGDSAGAAGTAPGGGGGGAKVTAAATARVGGAGGLGQILITYTIPSNFKANNTDALNLVSSWSAFVPNAGNIAEWNNLVAGPNTTSLGANIAFAGIKISDSAGPVTINGGGNTLTLGAAPTDLDLSAATQDLTLNSDLAMSAANVWNVASARTLTLNGIVSGSVAITKQGAGTAILRRPQYLHGSNDS